MLINASIYAVNKRLDVVDRIVRCVISGRIVDLECVGGRVFIWVNDWCGFVEEFMTNAFIIVFVSRNAFINIHKLICIHKFSKGIVHKWACIFKYS